MMDLEEALPRLRDLKLREKKLNAELKDLHAERKQLELELHEDMSQRGVDGMRINGIQYSPASTVMGQVENRDAFLAWAQEQDETLIDWKERKELINQLVRQYQDDGNPLPPGLTFYTRDYISTTSG